jgi:Ca2+-binding RTX toxin-like protein
VSKQHSLVRHTSFSENFSMTATVNVVTTAGINAANSDLYRYLANVSAINFPTATDYVGVDSTDGFTLFVTGTGLTYNGIHLTGGTITGISITSGPTTILTETFSPGLSALAVDTAAAAYLTSGLTNHAALDLIFLPIPYQFTGNTGDDTFVGGSAADNLNGGAGDDTLTGLAGADTIDGGTNTAAGDTVNYAASAAGITVTLGLAGAQTTGIGGDAAGDLISNIENIIGSGFIDTLRGNDLNNNIYGGTGNDTIEGGAGADHMDGGAGINTLTYAHSVTGVSASLGNSFSLGDAAGDSIQFGTFQNLTGGSGGDLLFGDANANIIDGGAGNDTIEAGKGGADTLIGGTNAAAGDTLAFATSTAIVTVSLAIAAAQNTGVGLLTISGFENLTGSNQKDHLTGNSNANVLNSNSGVDWLEGGGGGDTLIGNNTAYAAYTGSAAAVTVNLQTGAASGGDAQGDILMQIGGLVGSKFADHLTGFSAVSGFFIGGAGGDFITGSSGVNDTSSYETSAAGVTVNLLTHTASGGDAQGDVLTGIEWLTGSNFNDVFTAGISAGFLYGGGGNDVLTGSANPDLIDGGTGNDTIEGGAGGDSLDGGTGINTLSYAHDITGVAVDLTAKTASGGDAQGDFGTNFASFQNLTGGSGGDTLTGTIGDNIILGGAGVDIIFSDDGNDTVEGGAGADDLNGGLGIDTASYASSAQGVSIDLLLKTFSGGDATGDFITGFENVTGSALADTLTGNGINNTLTGGGGNDKLDGGGGIDTMTGGDGNDIYVVDIAGDITTETNAAAAGGIDLVQSAVTRTLGLNLENLTLTGALAINGTGNALANVLTGNGLANTLTGLAGNDTLNGGAGIDTMTGGDGNDIYVVDIAGDITTETNAAAAGGIDLVQSAVTRTLGLNLEKLTLTGALAINGTGNALANVLTGNGLANTLTGLAGADTLDGKAGADKMIGGDGNDIYVVDVAGDITTETNAAAAGGIDLVQSAVTRTLGLNFENLTLTGALAINGTGNALANVLTGNGLANTLTGLTGNDTLYGGVGADVLDGGNGSDILNGGAGKDTLKGAETVAARDLFRFSAITDSAATLAGADVITGFDKGGLATDDKIDLSLIDANPLLAGNQAFTFLGSGAFTALAGEVRLTVVGADTYVHIDTNATAADEMVIKVTGVTGLTAVDFVL